jgi:hypothetical protein
LGKASNTTGGIVAGISKVEGHDCSEAAVLETKESTIISQAPAMPRVREEQKIIELLAR